MSDKEEKRKINFIKEYWMEVLNINIYTYEEFKLNNLNTYLDELLDAINLIEHESVITKRKNGLLFFLEEIESYLTSNYFFTNEYSNEVLLIKTQINTIINSSDRRNIRRDLLILKGQINELTKLKKIMIDRMLTKMNFLVYSKISLDDSVSQLKSIVNDLIVELLNTGYTLDFLTKKVYKEKRFNTESKKTIDVSLREQFQHKIELFYSGKRLKKMTVIFRINNLKIRLPYKVKNLTFYNPLRKDLLKWKFKEDVYIQERGLLSAEEGELFFNANLEDEKNSQEIEYTDAHCRIVLQEVNPDLAIQIARKNVEEVVDSLRYIYALNHIKVSTEAVVIFGLSSTSPLFRNIRNEKFSAGSYRGFNITEYLSKDIQDDKSFINLLLNTQNERKETLLKAFRSLHLGEDADITLNKYIHYWLALEYLVGTNESGNIKTSILNYCSRILTRNYFRMELLDIYNSLRQEFQNKSGAFLINEVEIPDEIKNIRGLDHFMIKCDSQALADNLTLFTKYINNEYLLLRIKNFSTIYVDLGKRSNFVKQLEQNFKNLLSRLYRIRNKIMHSALIDEIELKLYSEWLHSILLALCSNLIYELDNPEMPFNEEYIAWKNKIRTDKYKIVNYLY